MQESRVTSEGQTTLPIDVSAVLKINVWGTLRYVVSGGEVRILKARSVTELSGMLRRSSQASVSAAAMDEVIVEGATS